jgi:hypothetical protein
MIKNHKEQIEFLSSQFEEMKGCDFYQYIFPDNQNKGEKIDKWQPNAVYLYHDGNDEGTKRRLRRRIMLNDTWEEDYMEYVVGNENTLCSGLTYRGRANRIDKAQRMNALVFDLDGVGLKELRILFLRFGNDPEKFRTLPMPTFVVSSGYGIHVYYVFREPIDLYPNIKIQLKALKYELTFRLWEYKETSQEKAIQYQSINQGFRMIGSLNSKYGTEVRAFQTGERVTLDYINQYVTKHKVDVNRPFKPAKMTREQAKEAYPEWYQRVVVEKNKSLKKWDIAGKQGDALYKWWIKQWEQIRGGHRYFFLMCMAIYACKCDVPKSRLKSDMYEMLDILKSIPHENEMTEYDIESALEAYDKAYYNFTIADIEKLTDIRIERNVRKGLKQKQHLHLARNRKKDMENYNIPFKNLEGRPVGSGTKEQLVKDYLQEHPEDNPTQIARALGISRPTVYKYIK